MVSVRIIFNMLKHGRAGSLVLAGVIMAMTNSCGPLIKQRPVDLVYPLLDTDHSRWFFFSSASCPFGMVSLFPDTKTDGAWKSGYRYEVDTIRDFSHIHDWQLSGMAVMPVAFSRGKYATVLQDWSSSFTHADEVIRPGYHSVNLDRYNITAELTATNRTGFHRYTFPEDRNAGVIFQFSGQLGPSEISGGSIRKKNNFEVEGYMINGPTFRRPKPVPVYFYATFNKPIKEILLCDSVNRIDTIDNWKGRKGNILIIADQKGPEPLMMKMGISFTGETGAANNAKNEIPDWNFDAVRKAADGQWNKLLSRIEIKGGTLQQQRRFYTDLWHTLQGRRVISDLDGRYADLTGDERKVRQLPLDECGVPEFKMYNSDAFWGAQWTLNTLWQLVYPEIAEDFCNSFLEYYKNGGLVPRGPSGGNYTFVMTGAPTTSFFVSAWQKGILGFDGQQAYLALKKNHLPGGLMSKIGYEHFTHRGGGLKFYMDSGYCPYPFSDTIFGSHQDGAGITLENAYQDWCLAQFAKALGDVEDYEYFMKRSENFRNIYDSVSGFMVPKDRNGKWKSPYDPLLYDNGFIEANGAQSTWFVPHDLPALFSLMGGADSAVQRLNREFEDSRQFRFCNEHPEIEKETGSRFVNDRRTWINYSNQPNSQVAFIFNHAGAPWLTQYWSRTVVDSVFSGLSTGRGYNGDEDQGLMGALAVLMKMGLFQMSGGCEEDPVYEIGSPVFKQIIIHLDPEYYGAGEFNIFCRHNNSSSPFIQSAKLNGEALKTYYIRQSDIRRGATLKLDMGAEPNKELWKENN